MERPLCGDHAYFLEENKGIHFCPSLYVTIGAELCIITLVGQVHLTTIESTETVYCSGIRQLIFLKVNISLLIWPSTTPTTLFPHFECP
jgi:hypothetical protein